VGVAVHGVAWVVVACDEVLGSRPVADPVEAVGNGFRAGQCDVTEYPHLILGAHDSIPLPCEYPVMKVGAAVATSRRGDGFMPNVQV